MSATIISKCNAYHYIADFAAGQNGFPGMNLGSKTFGNSVTRQATDLQPAVPVRCRLFLTLTSGTLTLNVQTSPSGTTNFGSPLATVTASDTAEHVLEFVTDSTNKVVSVQAVSGSSGAVVNTCELTFSQRIPVGGGYHELSAAINAVPVGQAAYTYIVS